MDNHLKLTCSFVVSNDTYDYTINSLNGDIVKQGSLPREGVPHDEAAGKIQEIIADLNKEDSAKNNAIS